MTVLVFVKHLIFQKWELTDTQASNHWHKDAVLWLNHPAKYVHPAVKIWKSTFFCIMLDKNVTLLSEFFSEGFQKLGFPLLCIC